MNLFLLEPGDLESDSRAVIRGRSAELQIEHHALIAGISIRAGVRDGKLGRATVASLRPDEIILDLKLEEEPPSRLPILLVVAACRPQTVKKVIQAAVTLGIEELHFVRAEKSEKSYLTSSALLPEEIAREIDKGLSQAVDTVAPAVTVHAKFLPFFEDNLPRRILALGWSGETRVVADTARTANQRADVRSTVAPWVVAVGPEAGWSEFELQRLAELRFNSACLGPRILRVETATTALISQLMLRN